MRIALVLSLAALLMPAVFAQTDPIPGTVNYVEGAASINGRVIHQRAVGSAAVGSGQILSTRNGRAEVLLTPGVFLRMGHNSAVQMISPDLTRTQVRVTEGKATVEVLQIFRENMLLISEDGVTTRIVKPGLYEFDAHAGLIRTFNGRALAFVLPNDPKHPVVVRTSHELMIPSQTANAATAGRLKARHFDRKQAENTDGLFAWSSLRSRYLAEENMSLAYQYAGYGGFAPGWYGNPYFSGYTWLPGGGMFWDPFGWGFYSPWWVYNGFPVYGGFYGGGFYGGGFYGRGAYGRGLGNAWRGNGARPGFANHGGPIQAFHGNSGFHGGGSISPGGAMGGGGFHGGAIGGGAVHGH